ncbi:hypothetical protein [Streptomyces sp. NPDC046805]|uniref:hypothetical protein n=1 Tax=Streptomyces sp. NPDC046805 TaxID=3155134 RepID=UPI0034118497
MRRIRTYESIAVRALRNGDTKAAGEWVRRALPTINPEQLPAPVIRHPLEFICFPLYRSGKVGLCLHVWPESGETSSPVVHAHSWDLWSYVVCGTAFNQMVDIREEPERPEHALYAITSVGTIDEVRATGRRVTSAPRSRQAISAGQIYRISSGLFHRSGHQGLTVTLVLGEQHEERENLVLGPLDGCPRHDAPRETCSPDEARALLQCIAAYCHTDIRC